MNKKENTVEAANFAALNEAPAEMKQRLLNLIESQSEYFTITGSDARDINSCCPSDGVTAANLLVESGVLQVIRPNEATDACPVNVYAFAGEIKPGETQPEFEINAEFRQKVKEYISRNQKTSGSRIMTLLRWALLVFVLSGLIMIGVKNFTNKNTNAPVQLNLVNEFDLPFSDGILILLFHREQRCDFCNSMESHVREAITQMSPDLQNEISFRLVNMDLPKYSGLKEKYNVFASTVVLLKIQNRKETRALVFSEGWQLFDKREKFIEAFKIKLSQFKIEE